MKTRETGLLIGAIAAMAVLLAVSRWTRESSSEPLSDHGVVADPIVEMPEGPGLLQAAETRPQQDPETETAAVETEVAQAETPAEAAFAERLLLGVVLDERSGEPVPKAEVAVFSANTAVPLDLALVVAAQGGPLAASLTNDVGRVELRIPSLDEPIRVLVGVDGVIVKHFDLSSEDAEVELRVPIGPTLPLQLLGEGERPDGGWQARLVESMLPGGTSHELAVLERGFRVLTASGEEAPFDPSAAIDRAWSWQPVRGTEPDAWLRYPTIEHQPDRRFVVRVELKHVDNGWVGRAPVVGTVGRQLSALVVVGPRPVERGCALVGRVECRRYGSVQGSGRTRVVLLPTRAELARGDRPPLFEDLLVEDGGTFRFEGFPPGPRRLVAYRAGYSVAVMDVVLEPGVVPVPVLSLRGRSDDVDFQLRFRRRTLPESTNVRYLSLTRPVAGEGYCWGSLQFDGDLNGDPMEGVIWGWVPHGELVHLGIGLESPPRWKPGMLTRWTSPEPVELEYVEDEELVRFGFQIEGLPEAPGAPEVRTYFGPGGSFWTSARAREETRWSLQPELPLRFIAWAAGCVPIIGTERDFADRGEERIAPLRFERGWGGVLHFRAGVPEDSVSILDGGPSGQVWRAPPVPGVGVRIDGEIVGHSDSEGRLVIRASQRPARIELLAPGWRPLTALELSYNRRANDLLPHLSVVWMARD